jgi:hypothetical protein
MFLKYSKTISLSLLITLCLTNQQGFATYNSQDTLPETTSEQNEALNPESTKSTLDTTQRIILQSIVETLWNLIKENHDTKISVIKTDEKDYKLELTDFGKIFSNLVVDEIIPTPKQTTQQKFAELLIPTIAACLATKIIPEIKEKNYIKIPSDLKNLSIQLLTKLLMVRLFLKPGTMKYNITNRIALLGSFYKYNPEKFGVWKYASVQQGLIKLTQDGIKNLVEISDLNENLNQVHRKKAIRKIIQALIEPYMQLLMDKACIHY